MRHTVLVFAGADPSGGAGIAADIVAIAAQGAHALPVITALTVQDNDRVFGVQAVAPELLRRQALALIDKMAIHAVKIGIPGSAANAAVIAQLIAQLRQARPGLPVVLDPVLASGHGDVLSRDDAVQALAPLLPVTTVIVPNGPEAAALGGEDNLLAQGCQNVLVTGGHGDGEVIVNRWFDGAGGEREWRWPRLPGEFHGSGCTLASAIAARLALGQALPEALDLAQRYCHAALAGAYAIAPGQLMPQRFIQ
ncbi:hydroxymethylpyrimidine/phosphomethylpyrimidine kinase [Janthinobacterium rivuli]|uniref:hydroxymethylpyrimidine kinase n=1 Tax=Janthinobacterium rivuli TaxID=2751478 RepID=A0ABY8ICY3_9BURK|nr:hydroxymethylpyrimidine/phosphomethylpyrimidine kinase [Janthinobacterium rivuli]WFR82311.1 hydroxymethylpyrimidine/phosphomethylpyrimidine kinase [Janthinobacterium rivuli]